VAEFIKHRLSFCLRLKLLFIESVESGRVPNPLHWGCLTFPPSKKLGEGALDERRLLHVWPEMGKPEFNSWQAWRDYELAYTTDKDIILVDWIHRHPILH